MGMGTINNRTYSGIILGVAIRGSIGKTTTFRVRPGNGHQGALLGTHYQDQYAYFLPTGYATANVGGARQQWIAAVHKWRYDLTLSQKKAYNIRANKGLHMSGFNLFMREAMKGLVQMYVDRGDPAAVDFAIGDLTDDATWRELDISAIIPLGAKAVLFEIDMQSVNAGREMFLKKYGQTNDVNHWHANTLVGNQHQSEMAIVAVDHNRKVLYNLENATWAQLDMILRGWWT